jgi:hypothetical protein
MSGEHAVHGFANRDLRAKLTGHLGDDPRQQSAQVSRLLHRVYVYALIAKIPRSRRWRVTAFGHRVMGASVRRRQLHFRRSRPRRREEPREFHCQKQRTNDGRIYALQVMTDLLGPAFALTDRTQESLDMAHGRSGRSHDAAEQAAMSRLCGGITTGLQTNDGWRLDGKSGCA